MPFKGDSQKSADGSLSAEVQEQGLATLKELQSEANALGAVQSFAIATEVFRTSPNGMDYLSRVTSELGIPVSILTQDEEAEVGLATAEAYANDADGDSDGGGAGGGAGAGAGASECVSSGGTDPIISWDSGSGSFQFCTRNHQLPCLASYDYLRFEKPNFL